jgi:low temperature requirement protein LtrA
MKAHDRRLLRVREIREARVTSVELFFDLVYVFAVTQLSHHLLANLSLAGSLQTLVLWLAVFYAWQYTTWALNWFDPEAMPVRFLLFGVMGVGLLMAAALPQAFAARGLPFALCYVAIQVGRTVVVLCLLGGHHDLTPNFRRILAWFSLSGVLWIAGAFAESELRLALWGLAVVGEYACMSFGFWFPGLGRSRSTDWTVEGGHLAERWQLFVIVALGESILIAGATLAHGKAWDASTVIAFLVAFLGSVAMWWVYFDTGSKAASHAIAHSHDPGRLGVQFVYAHVVLVAGVIVSAVGNELVIDHPHGPVSATHVAVLVGGPMLYLLGNAIFKGIVFGRLPLSHLVGLSGLVMLTPLAYLTDLLVLSGLTTLLLIVVAVWESVSRRRTIRAANVG